MWVYYDLCVALGCAIESSVLPIGRKWITPFVLAFHFWGILGLNSKGVARRFKF